MKPPPIPPPAPDAATLENVRTGQRLLNIAVLINVLLYAAALWVPKTEPMLFVFRLLFIAGFIIGLAVGIVGMVRLTAGLGYGTTARVLFTVSLFIPCVALIPLLVLSGKANTVLKRAGYKVGLLGAAPKAT